MKIHRLLASECVVGDNHVSGKQAKTASVICDTCGSATQPDTVSITMWSTRGWVVIEDVDAMICSACQEQYYSEETKNRLLDLSGNGFPNNRVRREITVPVFSLSESKSPDTEDSKMVEKSAARSET